MMARSTRRGSIRPLDPEPGCRRWIVRISTGKNPEKPGKYGRINQVVHGPKRNAEALLTKLLGDHDRGAPVIRGNETLSEWLERSLELSSDLGPQTVHRARAAFKQLPETLRGQRLRDLRPQAFQALYADLLAAGKAPSTVLYLHRTLQGRLSHAVALEKLARNPLKGGKNSAIKLPRRPHVERPTLTGPQVATLLAETAGDRLGALWAVLVLGGLRPEEALALRWADYDGQTLQVRRALVWIPKQAPTFEPTKGKRGRAVPLPATAQRALQRHRAIQAAERLEAGVGYQADDLIFPTELGRPHRWQTAARALKAELKRLGLPALRPYDLRHTCATLLLQAGVPAKVVQERLGHSSIAITMDVYSHVTQTIQDDATARLEAALSPTAGQRFGNLG